jgi:hypothetical protein
VAALLARLEELSRDRPDRVLRLAGTLPPDPAQQHQLAEPFELLIFRGFSSSTTHPTAFDPDQPALPEGSVISSAELLAGPLLPGEQQTLRSASPVGVFLEPGTWD